MSVRTETQDGITTIMVDRPEVRNAVDRDTAEALAEAVRAFEANDSARVAVLCGAGDTFCAGADLKAAASGRPNRLEADGDGPMGPTRMAVAKPVIAAIAGHAVAGGLELALWCDLRVADDDAVLGVFCRRWGVPLIDSGTARLPRLIGQGRALDLVLTGRAVGAQEALSMGLVNRVVPKGSARSVAEALALEIARFPRACMLADRAGVLGAFEGTLEEVLAAEFQRGLGVVQTESLAGAERFALGAGRHGSFDDFEET